IYKIFKHNILMKKLLIFIIPLLLTSFVLASAEVNTQIISYGDPDSSVNVKANIEANAVVGGNISINRSGMENKTNRILELRRKTQFRAYFNGSGECPTNCECAGSTVKCEFENGRVMTIFAGRSGNIIIQSKMYNVTTKVELYKNDEGKVEGVFRNRTKVIMLPDDVLERLEARLNKKVEQGKIELNEDGEYVIETRRKAKLFKLFPVNKIITISIDAETGQVTRTQTNFLGKLSTDVETENEVEVNENING
ncbi:MAG: hypothetical protein Q7R95_05955, partial [bacterium]|nr:hypothetical protein [bacterium]